MRTSTIEHVCAFIPRYGEIQAAIVKRMKVLIVVKLEPQVGQKFRQAQIQFCKRLNDMDAKLNNGKKIFFDVVGG